MGRKWEDFLKDILDDSGQLVKNEVKVLLEETKSDSESFLKHQGKKIEKYLNQLAEGKITKKQFEGYLTDIKALTELYALQLSMDARVRAQRLTQAITELIINRLLSLL